MEKVFYKPWIGKDYQSGGIFNKKILVLGESHYCGRIINEGCSNCGNLNITEKYCREFTSNVISGFISREREHEPWMNTYIKFERALYGIKTNKEQREKIWNSVMFYNYVQNGIKETRTKPSKQEFDNSIDSFFEVLEEYRPDCVISWGKRLFGEIPDFNWNYLPFESNNEKIDGGYYLLKGGGKVDLLSIYHPSSGFPWEYWHKIIRDFLE